ncbi:MAG: AAA family ATPase [Dehalococcoidia bacterium]
MQLLTDIRISNFRSCVQADLSLSPYTPLVGYNNGGKSNILSAIAWLLEGSALTADDFNSSDLPVIVEGTIEAIDERLLELLEAKHRERIEPFCSEGRLRIRRRQEEPSTGKRGVKLDVWDLDSEQWVDNPTGIPAAISALFPEPIRIRAMQDAGEDVAKYKTTTTIGKLIGSITGALEEKHGAVLRDALDDVRQLLGADGGARAEELEDFDRNANEVVRNFFPGVRLAIHVPPPEVSDLFKAGTIRVYEGDNGEARDFAALGHGAQRAIQMALIQYLAQISDDGPGPVGRTLLLIDEPELYLHPRGVAIVRAALKRLGDHGFQVVFSTHSAQMVGISDAADTLMVRKSDGLGTTILPTLRAKVEEVIEGAEHQAETLFDLNNSSYVLFADRVLVAEGKAEKHLLPLVSEALKPIGLGDGTAALVQLSGGSGTTKALEVLRALGIPSGGVVDLDYAFRGGVAAGLVDCEAEELNNCRNVLLELQESHEFELGDDGFPINRGQMRAEEAFALLAGHAEAQPMIDALHQRLREHRIWLWTRGSLEHHLGLKGKGNGPRRVFIASLKAGDPHSVIADVPGVTAFLEWAIGLDGSS